MVRSKAMTRLGPEVATSAVDNRRPEAAMTMFEVGAA